MRRKLLQRLERHLKRARVSPTRFGIDFLGDPTFVFELRRGRVMRPPMAAKLVAYLERAEQALGEMRCPRR